MTETMRVLPRVSLRISLVVAAVIVSGCPRSFEAYGLRAEAGVASAADGGDAGLPDADPPDTDPLDTGLEIMDVVEPDADPRDAEMISPDADPRDADPPDVDPLDAGEPPPGPGEPCDNDAGLVCAASLTCVNGVCCTSACNGACEQCNASGNCEIAVGRECGATFDCTDYVHGLDTTNFFTHRCYAYAGSVRGTCAMNGTCAAATVASCAAQPAGNEITSCDRRCVQNTHNCVAGELASNVDRSTMCHLNVEAPNCDTECQNSASASAIQPAMCTASGSCMVTQAMDCGPYRCDETTEMCFTSCADENDCNFTFTCMMDNTCG
jgi:hypothetical protein